MLKKIRLRTVLVTVLTVVGVLISLLVVAWVGNNYRFRQEAVTIPGPEGEMAGVITYPEAGGLRGLVVMVHGDGPVNATQDGLYNPWFEGAADAGYATLSWSKPGVDGSEGNWLDQTMADRAREVSTAIDWARRDSGVPTQQIVLWGASQAGWVMPKVTRQRDDIDAVVAVGTAINWLRQGRFNLEAELDYQDADDRHRSQAYEESDRTRELLDRHVPYGIYRADTRDTDPMTEDRWNFVLKNYTSDAEGDLEASAARGTPVHLMVGDHDRNVDVAETEETYRRIFGPKLTVTHFDGAHSLARPVMEDNDAVGWATAVMWPRGLLARGVTDDYTRFLLETSQ